MSSVLIGYCFKGDGAVWASNLMIRPRVVGLWGADGRFWAPRAGLEPVIHRPLLPDGVMRTHGWRHGVRTVLNRDHHGKRVSLIRYREKPCSRSTGAGRPASVRHRLGMRQRTVKGPRRQAACK